jgi:hypothetical protein
MNVPSASVLEPLLALDPANTEELVQACRRFINAWDQAGNDLLDDLVIGFVSIDSQADDIGRWERDPDEDSADFYKMFYPAFIEEREAWRILQGAKRERN